MASTAKGSWLPALVLLVAVWSCQLFSPKDMYFSCDDGGCPRGLACNAAHYCVDDAGVEPQPDAGNDAGPDVQTLYAAFQDHGPLCISGGGPCIEYPLSGGRDITAIAGLSKDEVWVAGANEFAALWDGAKWRRVDARDAGSMVAIAGYAAVPREFVIGSSDGIFRLRPDLGTWEGPVEGLTPGGGVILTSVAANELTFLVLDSAGKCAVSNLNAATPSAADRNYGGSYYESATLPLSPRAAWGLPDGGFWIAAADGLYSFDLKARTAPRVDAGWTDLFAVTATADGQIGWATGDGGVVLRWDGTEWSPVAGAGETLVAAAAAGDEAWFAGASSAGVLFRHDGGVLVPVSTGATQRVLALWTPPDGHAWAVGQSGLILHWDGASWTPDPQAITRELDAVAAAPAGQVWAAGASATVLARDGGHWDRINWLNPDAGTIRAIWVGTSGTWVGVDSHVVRLPNQVEGTLAANVTALWGPAGRPTIATVDGTEGLYEWNGTNWVAASLGNPMYAVAGANGAVFAVGDSSRVATKSGATWVSIGTGLGGALRGVWTQDGGEIWVAGQNGYVASYSGTWVAHPGAPAVDLTALVGPAADDLYVVGAGGTVAHWTGSVSWDNPPSATQADLLGATYVPDAGLFAVGRGGVILHYAP